MVKPHVVGALVVAASKLGLLGIVWYVPCTLYVLECCYVLLFTSEPTLYSQFSPSMITSALQSFAAQSIH